MQSRRAIGIGSGPRSPRALQRIACLWLIAALASSLASTGCGRRDEGRAQPAPQRVRKTRPDAPPENRVELSGLRAYVGKLPDDVGLWETEPLRSRMRALLEEKYPAFLVTLTEPGPIEEENGRLIIKGKSPAQKRVDRGLVVIAPEENLLYLWCDLGGQVSEFKEKERDFTLPASARDWIAAK